MNLVIFGAQGYALSSYMAIKTLEPDRWIRCFLVSAMGINASTLGGIPVYEIGCFSQGLTEAEKSCLEVLIATPETMQPEIEEILDSYGLINHKRLTLSMWNEWMEAFHLRTGLFQPLSSLETGYHKPDIKIFLAESHKDRVLSEEPALFGCSRYLQVGAAVTDKRISELRDDSGENISDKNGDYSELTGLYWIWRNELCKHDPLKVRDESYIEFAQYRRVLDFSEPDLLRLRDNDVDVVLPYPLMYEPGIHVHHERYLADADWGALEEALQELEPEYACVLPEIMMQKYLYNYNVILAKESVLRAYCEWLFPVLFRAEDIIVSQGGPHQARSFGYMAETMETLYFIKNSERLKIVHTGCKLYI